jgi:DNA-directed RNA polymerase alpha subunit/DNA-directed RNA polymerase subunit L
MAGEILVSEVRTIRPGYISFLVENVDMSVANALRRTILSNIPNVAMDALDGGIDIKTNTSSLHNELIAHRLSMIPLCFDAEEVEKYDPTRYRFVIDKKNVGNDMLAVTTGDFDIYENDKKLSKEFVDRIFPRNAITGEHIVITKLKANFSNRNLGDHLHFDARASVNVASKHVCFSPVSLCTYYNEGDKESARAALKEIVSKASTPEDAAALEKRFNAIQRERFFRLNEYGEPNAFRFSVESECRMAPQQIIMKGLTVLKASVADLSKYVESCTIDQYENIFSFNVEGYDHTIGNLVQSLVYNMHVRGGVKSDKSLDYVGYFIPHPLENKMVIKMKFADVTGERDIRTFFIKALVDVATYLDHIATKFEIGFGITRKPETPLPLPVAETPLPVAETPLPVAETPLPAAETPLPAAETPLPAAETPAAETPAAETPLPTKPSD